MCILCDEEALQNRRKTACRAVRLTPQCSHAPSNLTPADCQFAMRNGGTRQMLVLRVKLKFGSGDAWA
jgi:hypothetical protein